MTEAERGPFENMGRRADEQFRDAGNRAEEEVKRVIAFLNDRVVPEVRQNSSRALRVAAEQLAKLAEHLDNRRGY